MLDSCCHTICTSCKHKAMSEAIKKANDNTLSQIAPVSLYLHREITLNIQVRIQMGLVQKDL